MTAQPVTHLHPVTEHSRRGPVTVRDAVAAFLSTPRASGSHHTRRAYTDVLHRVTDRLGPERELAGLGGDEVADALTALWGGAAPSTWNRNRAAVSSWLSWCTSKARWAAPVLPGTCERRREPRDHTRAVDRATIEAVHPPRHRPPRAAAVADAL